MRVLVTGGAGYVGSHTVRELLDAGHEPIILDNLSTSHAASVPEGVTLVTGDLNDMGTVTDVFSRYVPEAVFHFAGSTQVGESVENPGLYFRNNILGGLNVLQAMVNNDVRHFVFSSTAAVYGEPTEVPIPEHHAKAPTNPYGESKLFFEHILHRFDIAHGIQSVCLRYFNAAGAHASGLIGEDHTPETHLIPIVLQVPLDQRDEVTIFGSTYDTSDGTCIRDYVHVSDLAAAHVLALQYLQSGGRSAAFNLGNGQGFSVREVIDVASAVVGQPIAYKMGDRRPGDPAVLVASADQAAAVLGWTPRYAQLHDIIESAWRWHKTHPDGYTTTKS